MSHAPAFHTIATGTHGRYLVRPAAQAVPAGLLVGFHGYAQDAETQLADLEAIPGVAPWILVSVQALHRFYTRAGQVVASWMTSQDRELAIADNLAYVRVVVERVHEDLVAPRSPGSLGSPLVFAGFSQGAAMACRAAADIAGCHGVIALGGDIPPDVRAANRIPPVLLGRGRDDQWYTREQYDRDVTWLAAVGADAVPCEFEGGHFWTEEFRAAAGRFLERLATRGAVSP